MGQQANWACIDSIEQISDEASFPSRGRRQRVTLRLERQLLKKVKVLCALNGLNLQTVVEQGLDLLLASRSLPNWTPSSTGRPHDDLMIDDGVSEISKTPSSESSSAGETGRPDAQLERERELLAFYVSHTGNRLKARDRDSLREVSHLTDSAIKTGILRSIILCPPPARVNSLRYCVGAIREAAENNTGPEYVAYCLSKIPARPGAQPTLPSMGADVADIRAKRESSS